jgi:hypothetical protein
MADRGHRRSELVRTLMGIGVALLIVITALIATVEIQDRNDRMLEQRIARGTSDLKVTGGQIAGMRDALTSNMSEYISTYKELEPLLGQYENKLSLISEVYDQAQDRQSRRELADLVGGYRMYNPRHVGEHARNHRDYWRNKRRYEKARVCNTRHGVAARIRTTTVLARTLSPAAAPRTDFT